MTDYGGWTDEQINEAIFKAKGWVFAGKLSLCGWYRDTSKGRENLFDSTPPDYTYEWRLAGELLDELPADITTLSKYDDSVDGSDYWECVTGNALTEFSVICPSDNPKRAICEAWLTWKGVE